MENKKINKLDIKKVSLFDMRKSNHVLFMIETFNPFLAKEFSLDKSETSYFCFNLMFKNQIKNIEQILKFKKNFQIKELYLLVLHLYWKSLSKYWSLFPNEKESLE